MAEITVRAGSNLQTVINAAQPGDIVNVEAGATFRGPIELPAKGGSVEVVIQSSRVGELPPDRVSPTHASLMPKILCPAFEQAIKTKPGASFYKLDGLEVAPDPSVISDTNVIRIYDLVRLGENRQAQTALESVPHHIKLDRVYIHGLANTNFQRGISLNSMDTDVTRSYISEVHGKGMDAQAICSWNTPGRLKVEDCYLEGSGENFLLGGSDPANESFIPSNVQLLRSYLFKPLSWKGVWTVKNLLEVKAGKNLLFDGNVLENNWVDGQAGIAVLFTVRNQEGSAPYSIILNVTYSNNTLKNSQGALNFLGSDNEKPSQRCSGAVLKNNLFIDIKGHFLTLNGYNNISIEQNTHLQTNNTTVLYGTPSTGFQYRKNLTIERRYGIFGEGGLIGKAALDKWTPEYAFAENVMGHPPLAAADSWYTPMPSGNQYPEAVTLPADFRSPFAGIGCDIDALLAAQKSTSAPLPAPQPTPTPVPVPAPSPSPDGTKATSIVDAQGGVWTLGPQKETLRNGTHMASGFGSTYKWLGGVVYVLGTNAWWYKWSGSTWNSVSQTEPGVGPVTRVVSWPKQPGQQNALLDAQRTDRFYLRRIDGNNATFEKVS